MSAEWTLRKGMYTKTTRGSGKLDAVQPKNWTLPFTSDPHLNSGKSMNQDKITKQKFDNILKNNLNKDQNILKILIGTKPNNDKQEEQLLLNAQQIVPTLKMKEWLIWCKLIQTGNMKEKLINEMNKIIIYEPTENLEYLIKKVISQDSKDSQMKSI